MKLKPDVKELWVAALKSGEYVQGRFSLRKNSKFCCLGVLCDIAPFGEWDEALPDTPTSYLTEAPDTLNRKDFPPPSVLQWAGLSVLECHDLATLNDDEGADFEGIANYIKVHL